MPLNSFSAAAIQRQMLGNLSRIHATLVRLGEKIVPNETNLEQISEPPSAAAELTFRRCESAAKQRKSPHKADSDIAPNEQKPNELARRNWFVDRARNVRFGCVVEAGVHTRKDAFHEARSRSTKIFQGPPPEGRTASLKARTSETTPRLISGNSSFLRQSRGQLPGILHS